LKAKQSQLRNKSNCLEIFLEQKNGISIFKAIVYVCPITQFENWQLMPFNYHQQGWTDGTEPFACGRDINANSLHLITVHLEAANIYVYSQGDAEK
jgi:hypothetical protein